MPRPQTITMSEFISAHNEDFVKYELWVADELSDHLVASENLDPANTSVIVDLDLDNAAGKNVDDIIQLRLNGRFYVPKFDENGHPLKTTPDQWIEIAQEWFNNEAVEAVFDEDAVDLIKFTAFVDAVELPPSESGGGGEETEETEDTADTEETEDTGGEETEEVEEIEPAGDTGEETETADDDLDNDEEFQEFSKDLGL